MPLTLTTHENVIIALAPVRKVMNEKTLVLTFDSEQYASFVTRDENDVVIAIKLSIDDLEALDYMVRA